jgi:hypothetical protein
VKIEMGYLSDVEGVIAGIEAKWKERSKTGDGRRRKPMAGNGTRTLTSAKPSHLFHAATSPSLQLAISSPQHLFKATHH